VKRALAKYAEDVVKNRILCWWIGQDALQIVSGTPIIADNFSTKQPNE